MKSLYLPAKSTLQHPELIAEWICNYCDQRFSPADLQQNNYLFLVAEQAGLVPAPLPVISFRLEEIVHQICPLPKGFTRQL